MGDSPKTLRYVDVCLGPAPTISIADPFDIADWHQPE
jgi:hypothetical protein